MQITDKLDRIRSELQDLRYQYSNSGSVSFDVASSNIADSLSYIINNTAGTSAEDNSLKNIDVRFITPKKDNIVVCRTFPRVDLSITTPFDDYLKDMVVNHADRATLTADWNKIQDWIVEIDTNLVFGGYDSAVSGTPRISVEAITAMLVLDAINVITTDDVSDLIYDAYCDSYFPAAPYVKSGIRVLYKLYLVPALLACSCKNWLVTGDPIKVSQSLHVSADAGLDMLSEYLDAFQEGIARLVQYTGSGALIRPSKERFVEICQRMLWVTRYANDYIMRRDYIRDDLLLLGTNTGSMTMRAIFLALLDNLGLEMHERYTGNLIPPTAFESVILPAMDDKVKFMNTYRFDHSPKNHGAWNLGFEALESMRMKNGFRKVTGKPPLLPSDRRIDLIFVDIDKMRSQFDRKAVLDEIYDVFEAINAFEEFYADNDTVMRRYAGTIEDMRNRLNQARAEVLNKRNFKTNYRVFIDYPAGYDG